MEFKIRPQKNEDLEITFQWRNDPEVLKNAQTSNVISFNEHEAMYKFNNSVKLIFEVDGVPAGIIACTRITNELGGEWSFHMGADHRGKGLSEVMLNAALFYLGKEEAYERITSRVLSTNAISKHLHSKIGFKQTGEKDNFFEYEIEL